ncbi:2,3,4,5-tetrahydropyridine-2,6-dicarboxylate N-succinyltransferase [Candidatus Riesia pediculischaeffi]|uniref:2,3,4,5-tetrahydropyridine-2,6-dicarboxylate N-succinyltransferase n=1 Tax=Candidatus Riesia pediculischaeffi TaxID=428411 RepID=A0A1V0HKB5_9ENTR|nr:2,3,4,5-tetrahydropyridine-2,6-dicarboxylate N-succinyltransferase [Candidatus Riesia pediculischaeffi]ARC53270.1 2,3,4,5-tetrahydropyridine-2,6-dicarboxylate N-succinyltransferase [Candidatus Riesia pediculischaeffi]
MEYSKKYIKNLFKNIEEINSNNIDQNAKHIVEKVIFNLNIGKIRIAEKIDNVWKINHWIKQAILIYFKISKNKIYHEGRTKYFDKIDSKFSRYSYDNFNEEKIRVVPTATVRYGSFIDKNSILMPCYVNIGAYIGRGTMIDTWSTIGSCAQIGNNVHISGGVGIGGVLEPIQENPTIIEDGCFIGARSEIAEGIIVQERSVIAMGVYIGKSTKIYDRETGKVIYGVVPSRSVVIPGTIPDKFGRCDISCAIIAKKVDVNTEKKISINHLLRDI